MRFVTLFIAALCFLPVALVLSSWLTALPADTQANWQHVRQTVLPGYITATLSLAACVLLLTLPLGIGAAWCVTHYEFTGRKTVQWMLMMPLALPGYISAFAYGAMFDYAGPLQTVFRAATGLEKGQYWFFSMRGIIGASWVLGFAILPYVYLLARAGFASQPPAWLEVAQSMGISRHRFFWKAALPAARPYLATGAALVLMEALADIGTVGVLGVPTLSSGIYRTWAYMREPLIAARMAALLLAGVMLLLLAERVSRRRINYSARELTAARTRILLDGRHAACAMCCCWLPVIAGFLLPLTYVLRMFFFASHGSPPSALWHNTRDTFLACGVSGMLICLCAVFMVLSERRKESWLRYANLFATLSYAMPGVVIAIGMLMLMGWLRQATSWVLIGNLSGLFTALVIRYLAIGYNQLHGAATRIPPEMDMAAASLGGSGWKLLSRVHIPLLRIPLETAFILVSLDILKELPLTLILRPFGFKTLVISAYDFASDDRAAEAAPFALTLILLACLALFLLHQLQRTATHHGQH